MHRSLVLVVSFLLVASAAPVAGAQGSGAGSTIDLKIAKTRHYVEAFGTIEGARRGDRVKLTLLLKGEERFERFTGSGGTIEQMRDGKGIFLLPAGRPKSGTCRAKVLHGRNGVWTKAVQTFDCSMPWFPRTSGRLTGAASTKEISVLLADTPERRGYGLMFRRYLPAGRGMAFIFEGETSGGFWMRNTLIPLSIAFYDSDGTILRVMDMDPCTADPCEVYDPGVTYSGALEVNQGAFKRWGIGEGDTFRLDP
jgi:uncharacterized membrane protein (UPF0127 family)